ncbi:hypothetical protein NPIL_33771 [Nephila pilipes]|uniref:Uncharacterized protein n=1 Tax=Nephila pilipes TaxID=299642 RepID=A0A8X6US57_NEPPI|nr:hypothetical protein NPIL_33771 [Nephila pilipes]
MQREDEESMSYEEVESDRLGFLMEKVANHDSTYKHIIGSYEHIKSVYLVTLESEHLIPDYTTTWDKKAVFDDIRYLYIRYEKLIRSMKFAFPHSWNYLEYFHELRLDFSHHTIQLNHVDFEIAQTFSTSVWLLSEVIRAVYLTAALLLSNILKVEITMEALGYHNI